MLKHSTSAPANLQGNASSLAAAGYHATLPIESLVTGDDQAAQDGLNEGQGQNEANQIAGIAAVASAPKNALPHNQSDIRPPQEKDLLEGAVDAHEEPDLGDWEPDM